MYKITFPRIGFDGKERSQKDIEVFFIQKFYTKIKLRLVDLRHIKRYGSKEYNFLSILLKGDNLKQLLLISPSKMPVLIRYMSIKGIPMIEATNRNQTKFGKDLYEAFNYDGFRSSSLVQLAKLMNLKSCPYCNHQYTLYLYNHTSKGNQSLAKFQYDHFFSKVKYPYLSMSLYNLIPSCAICNQGKSYTDLDVKFNPYVNDVGDEFCFEVAHPESLFTGKKSKDEIELKLSAKGVTYKQNDIDVFDDKFNIKAQYARHKDIVQEIYDKTYLEPYFWNRGNFPFLKDIEPMRLLLGTYTGHKDIEKRPMTKFIQDLWEQLSKLHITGTDFKCWL